MSEMMGYSRRGTLDCRGLQIELGERTLIMGILNMTPDSFSDGGQWATVDQAVTRAQAMVEEGADIIDVGGESTRPGAAKVSLQEELRRVIPVVEALKAVVNVPISVDTYKAETARQALAAGAHLINDIWGLKADAEMGKVIAEYGCPVVLMHNRKQPQYRNLVAEVLEDLRVCIELARRAGVAENQIILDPGIGFGKTPQHNLIMMTHLNEIVQLGYPVLLGTSRKSFIRQTLKLPADDVVEGTGATTTLGIAQGCAMIRVHDVLQMKRVAVMTDAMLRSEM